ncbi:MAG: DUF63 family protein [Halobacteriales archaeon]|nr:DUF63 family protein [Halobacteriales archaeon]
MLDDRRSRLLWLTAVLVPIAVVGVGSLVRPDIFYDRFFWKYLYGPIVADSQGGVAELPSGVTATPGYTVVSSAVYAYYLLLAVVGSVELFDRFEVGDTTSFFFALVPYGFLGGALRVVEDAGAFEPPVAYFFISPVIYITMFVFTAVVFLSAVYAEREGAIDDYAVPVAGAGTVAFVGVAAYLVYFGVSQTEVTLWIPAVVVGAATVVFGVVWLILDRFAPVVNEGTGRMGAVLLWAHLLDAFSTVVGVEYLGYSEKQPIVDSIISLTGTTYSFVLVKTGIVLLILYAFDERFFEEFRRLPYILLVAVLAVGLGPGTRNTLRMTLGI